MKQREIYHKIIIVVSCNTAVLKSLMSHNEEIKRKEKNEEKRHNRSTSTSKSLFLISYLNQSRP